MAAAAVVAEDSRVAEEQRRLGVGRLAPDLGDRTLLDDPAGPHHRHPVGDGERLLVVVGDHQRGGAGRPQDVAQVGGQAFAQAGVEGRQRLVEQQQARLGGERPGQGDALALAAGEGRGQPVAVPRQADELEQLVDPRRVSAARRRRRA